MIRHSYLTLGAVITLMFSSCYYPAQVVIHNKSGEDINIQVINPDGYAANSVGDSLTGYDHTLTESAFSSRDYYRYGVSIPRDNLDTVRGTYSFLLKDKQQVIVENTWPVSALPWGQSFVVNNVDTVVLKKKSKAFKKRGGSWTYTISNRR